MKDSLVVGLTFSRVVTVDVPRTIDFMGDSLRVYSTPSMLDDMEHACRDLTLDHLFPGEDSVGIEVALTHVGAAVPGQRVRISARVVSIEDRKLGFEVEASTERNTVGRATHHRFVVDMERQRARLLRMVEELNTPPNPDQAASRT